MNQTYKNWELCIADDCSPDASVWATLQEQTKRDRRIKITRLKTNGHICRATNEAFKLSTGTFVALLDHDDILAPDALSEIAHVLIKNPDTEFIYTDEDKLTIHDENTEPFFKPDFSPQFLRSCNYITHFSCFKKSLFVKIIIVPF